VRKLALAVLLAAVACGKSSPKDEHRQRECDDGSAAACVELAREAKDPASKADAWARGCKVGMMEACANLAVAYRDGNGVAPNPVKALDLLQKTCAGQLGTSCNVLGWSYRKGDIVPRDEKQAVELFTKACNYGSDLGCGSLADAVEHGLGGATPDPVKAKELYAQACGMGDKRSCDDARRLGAAGEKPCDTDDNGSCDRGGSTP
jgi:TPR repeat protein